MNRQWNKTIVVSAVNLVEGGTFTILQQCLNTLSESFFSKDYRVVALVNSKRDLPSKGIEYIEYPKAKKSYLYRLYYEYVAFKKVSKRLKPLLWLSLHDMSPRVEVGVQAVYMHNPTPFYSPKFRDWKYVPINAVWAYLYKYLYKINIHSNKYLIVQQQWIRNEFSKMFSFPKDRIVVARPENEIRGNCNVVEYKKTNDRFIFLYPALPRVFKNHDVICKAAKILEDKGIKKYKIILTIDGNENGYSKYLREKYSKRNSIEFHGLFPKNEMTKAYLESDCLLFPSKLETWGLPISEYKTYDKPMLVADLPYAHETSAGAKKVSFFDPDDANELAIKMEKLMKGDVSFCKGTQPLNLEEPNTSSWIDLFSLLLKS